MWPFRKKQRRHFMDAPLVNFGRGDGLTPRALCSGAMICGPSGSGKSSGPLKGIVMPALEAGFPAFLLSNKQSDCDSFVRWAEAAGREPLVFEPGGKLRYDPFECWSRGGEALNITEAVLRLDELLDDKGGEPRRGEKFWENGTRQLCNATVDALMGARAFVTGPDIVRFAMSLPGDAASLAEPKGAFWDRCMEAWHGQVRGEGGKARFEMVMDYVRAWASMHPPTRNGFEASLTGTLDPIARPGTLRELFCSGTNITPEQVIEENLVLVVRMPTKKLHRIGVIANGLWNYAIQRAVECREVGEETPPILYVTDEYQQLAMKADLAFQETCRDRRCMTIRAFQTPDSLFSRLPESTAKAIMHNLSLKIFCSMPAKDAQLVSEYVGKTLQTFDGGSTSNERPETPFDLVFGENKASMSFSTHYEYLLQPAELARLRRGGPENGYQVDTIVYRGAPFSNGEPYLIVSWDQRS